MSDWVILLLGITLIWITIRTIYFAYIRTLQMFHEQAAGNALHTERVAGSLMHLIAQMLSEVDFEMLQQAPQPPNQQSSGTTDDEESDDEDPDFPV